MASGTYWKSYFKEVARDMDKAQAKRYDAAGQYLRDKIKAKIRKKRISLPGEPPGKHGGNLLKGIKMARRGIDRFVGAMAPAFHAMLLEFGTAIMKKRPFLWPTFQEERDNVISKINDVWIK